MKSRFVLLGLAIAGLSISACKAPERDLATAIDFGIDIDVSSDPGKGIANADIVAGNKVLARTDAAGRAAVQLQGTEGDIVTLDVRCPEGFVSSKETMTVAIHRLSSASRRPHFDGRCSPQRRVVVIGVRTERGANLPILHLGREVGRTDASGAALVLLSVKPGEHVSLVLDTKSERTEAAKLVPESPTLTFVAKDRDDFVTLDQRFDIERAPQKHISKPRPAGPTRI